jgi:hypothetical protein
VTVAPHEPTSSPARPRPAWRSVAVPSEHGGWALTLEPVVLGLLVAPSVAGALLGLAAFVAFLARTPLKVALVDRRRQRHLPRTRLAATIAAVEVLLIVGLAAAATWSAGWSLWVPLVVALPLVAVQLSFDVRSRSRRLVPELAGTVAMGSVAAAIVVAGGGSGRVAAAAWLVLAVRAVATMPAVRDQVRRAKGQPVQPRAAAVAQVLALVVATVAVVCGWWPWPILVAVVLLVAVQLAMAARRPVPAAVIGVQQLVLGLVLIITAGLTLA